VENWLDRNYQAPVYSDLIHAALIAAEKKLDTQERQVLQLFYGHKLNEQQIATQLDRTQSEVTNLIRKTRAKLEASVIK
jgi:RNA polymerase sigma factor (sigma-70 family)